MEPSGALRSVVVSGIELTEEIGRGAQSVVYRGKKGSDERFVVKLQRLEDQARQLESAHRFHREAAVLARLHHPGLPQVFDSGVAHGRAYIVMEYVAGQQLDHGLPPGGMEEARAVAFGLELLGLLGEIHQHGLVHRDLKPSNVLLDANGRVRLLDFGLTGDVETQGAGEGVVGTMAYAAPEQLRILKRPVDERADVYAVGAMLFQCLTGRPPFAAGDVAQLLHAVGFTPAPDVRATRPEVSAGLAQVVAKALAKDPDDRYRSAPAMYAALAALQGGRARGPVPETLPAAPLVGRGPELEKLTAAWAEARAGRGGAVLVEGAPGQGKSRLVRELRGRAQGHVVLAAKAAQGDPLPFAPLRAALEGLLAANDGDGRTAALVARLRSSLGEDAGLVARLTPALARALEVAPETQAGPARLEQYPDALARLLVAVAEASGGALFVLDDVQWLDSATLQVLRRLATMMPVRPLLLAMTARDDAQSQARVAEVRAQLGPALAVRLTLAPLSPPAVVELVKAFLGRQPLESPDLAALVAERTDGSPMNALEYLRAMLEGGLLRFSWGQWQLDRGGLDRLRLPTDLLALLLQRLSSLGPGPRTVLRAAALLAGRLEPQVLALALGLPEDAVLEALATAMRANLLERGTGEGLAFVHDRVREALVSEVPAAEAAGLHLALARALYQVGGEAQASAVAHHYRAANDPAFLGAAVRASVAAGRQALAADAPEVALEPLQWAMANADAAGVPKDAALHEALGDALLGAHQWAQAAVALSAAIAATPAGFARARLRKKLMRAYTVDWHGAQAWEQTELAMADIGRPLPKSEGLRMLSALWWWLLSLVVRRLPFLAGTAKGVQRERLQLEAQILGQGSFSAYFDLNPMRQLQISLRSMYAAGRLGPSPEMVDAYCNYAVALSILGALGPSLKVSAQAQAAAAALGDRTLIARAKIYDAWCHGLGGDLAENLVRSRQVLVEHDRWFDATDHVNGNGSLAYHELLLGHDLAAQRALARTFERTAASARTGGEHRALHPHAPTAATLHVRQGEDAKVGPAWADAQALAKTNRFSDALQLSFGLLIALEKNELGPEVEEAITRHDALKLPLALTEYHCRHFYLYVAYVRAEQLRLAQGDAARAQATRALEAALKRFKVVADKPLHGAHYQVALAKLLRARGQATQADQALARAQATAEALDGPWLHFEVALERARVHQAAGNRPTAMHFAREAWRLADECHWPNRRRRVELELGVAPPTRAVEQGSTVASSHASEAVLKQRLGALVQVGAASARVLDPEAVIRTALQEIVAVLSAERGYLFLQPEIGPATFAAGVSNEGDVLPTPEGFSRTVVDRVLREHRALVVSGTEGGEVVESESITVHGLRSIMAAPLELQGRFLGAIYLDNRVAKGVFTRDDVGLLTALASHIATALETARAAKLEVARTALEKDLAVTAAVQQLVLPRERSRTVGSFSVHGHYRPMQASGGDWWWHQQLSPTRHRVLLGDVSGHGAGAAMMTAAVASAVATLQRGLPGAPVPEQLAAVGQTLRELARGAYLITVTCADLDLEARTASFWFAGSPPVFALPAQGPAVPLTAQGTPLGAEAFSLGTLTRPFVPGERLLFFSDGLTDAKAKGGRPLGLKGAKALFEGTRGLGLAEADAALSTQLDGLLDGQPQEDDVALVLVGFASE